MTYPQIAHFNASVDGVDLGGIYFKQYFNKEKSRIRNEKHAIEPFRIIYEKFANLRIQKMHLTVFNTIDFLIKSIEMVELVSRKEREELDRHALKTMSKKRNHDKPFLIILALFSQHERRKTNIRIHSNSICFAKSIILVSGNVKI